MNEDEMKLIEALIEENSELSRRVEKLEGDFNTLAESMLVLRGMERLNRYKRENPLPTPRKGKKPTPEEMLGDIRSRATIQNGRA